MKVQVAGRYFQPGEGPCRGLLRDCENLADGSFEALLIIRAGFVQKHHCCTTASLDANKRVEVKSSPIHFHPQIIHCTVGDDVE